jgi:RNA polymerase sigma factor (TIGR02999 family)
VERLFAAVYEELHSLASRQLGHERVDHTLQPTALVHEAFLRMTADDVRGLQDRSHFLAVAATAMRRILINHAHARAAVKRGGGRPRAMIDEVVLAFEERATDLLALDRALAQLQELDPSKARIVELRFFGGLTMEEIGEVLGQSLSAIERSWRLARAWLRKTLEGGEE